MDQYQLKEAFVKGIRTFGTMIASPSPKWAAALSNVDLDFVFIDLEHMPLDRSQMAWMCQTYRALGIAPIVRISSPDPTEASLALDCGAAGIVAPYLETVEQATAMRGAVKFRPLKGNRLENVLAGKETLSDEEMNYLREYNHGALLILNIESRYAVDNLDNLLATPDVDAVFIGPHDLSISLGIPEQYDHPEFLRCVETIIKTCRNRGIGVGNHFSADIDKQVLWAKLGMDIVVWNADFMRFAEVIENDFNYIKEKL